MAIGIGRRQLMTALGGAAVVWPLAARAQQPTMPVIGFLHARAPEDSKPQVAAFRRGLSESGYTEGQNVTVEYRWGRGQYDQLPAMAAELVRRPVALLVAGSEPAALAAKAATSTIPIVFSVGTDPVKLGLVTSFNHPGGNATGMQMFTTMLEAKRLGLLHELVPRAQTLGILLNPNFTTAQKQLVDLQEAAKLIGLRLQVFRASNGAEIEAAYEAIARERIPAVMVAADVFFDTRRDQLIALAARHAVPVMYQFREYAAAGGLMSHGIDLPDNYRQAGIYAGRILKGEKPADLPVMQSTKFEFVINLKTPKALGLDVPPSLLAIADEVIE
jgi:putative tryptophan/tyrosine transport system substrate-binding protein